MTLPGTQHAKAKAKKHESKHVITATLNTHILAVPVIFVSTCYNASA